MHSQQNVEISKINCQRTLFFYLICGDSSKLGQKSPKGDARFEILRISRWQHPLVFELDLQNLDQI